MTQRLTWLILALVALALRLPDLGNPLVDLDEQMYLLVGQHMWAGAIPYVDIWDRKPIGLFLLYAASQAIPGDPVVAYQLVALAAATATAGVIALCVRRLGGGAWGALGAGVLYLVWLELIGGRGGQSPVFYDLPVAWAALLAWDTISGRRRAGPMAMLLIGVALQLKPTVVFEGCFLGAALLVASWRRHRRAAPVLRDAAIYGLAALAPTIAAAGVYLAMGHGEAWWFANVRSIFLRRVTADDPIGGRLLGQAIVLFVPVILALRGLLAQRGAARMFMAGWLAAAVVGWLLVPPYFNHYALPLLVPMAVAAGMALERWTQAALAVVAGAVLLGFSGYPHRGETEDNRRRLAALAQVVRAHTGQGCPFVFQAPPAIYTAARACLPGRYPFPPHLVEASERGAIGVDPVTEVRRILAGGPPVVVAGPLTGRADTVRIVAEVVARRYRPVARDLGMTVYVRRN